MLKKSIQLLQLSQSTRHLLQGYVTTLLSGTKRRLCDGASPAASILETTQRKSVRERTAQEFLNNLDSEMREKKTNIEFDWHTLQTSGHQVPQHLSAVDWKVLLTECPTYSKRKTYFYYLYKRELHKESDMLKKLKKKEQLNSSDSVNEANEEKFLFRTAGKMVKKRQAEIAACLGNPFVIDVDYEQSRRELIATYRQLVAIHAENTTHLQPFNVHLTGATNFFVESVHEEALQRVLDIQIHKDSFMDLFPRDRLVYLTPNGPPLTSYNGDDVYIMAGLVDLHDRSRRSLSKAKSLGIRVGSLPLRRHVVMKSHTLTLDCVFKILLDMNLHHDWKSAIWSNIPTRLIYNAADPPTPKHAKRFKEYKEIYSSR